MKTYLMRTLSLFVMGCACSLHALAVPTSQDTTMVSPRQVEGVTVVAPRVRRAISASKPIQVMDKEELRTLGLTDMAAAVKRFACANVRDYGGIGGVKTVSIRGFGTQHTAVSYDGVTISNTQAGQIDLGRYSLDNVSSLSLAVGDNSDLMQTARHLASAGVLYIETEKPQFDAHVRPYALRIKARGGSFGLVNPSLRYWQRLADSTTLSVQADYMTADGDYPFTLVNGNESTRERRLNSDIYTWRAEANLYHTSRIGDLNVKAYWYYAGRGLPGSVVLYNPVARERLWDEDFFLQASYRKRLGERWRLSAHLKYTHSWNRYTDVDVKYPDGQLVEVNRQNEYYASATIGWHPLPHLAFSLAEDLVYGDLRSNARQPVQPKRYTSLTAFTVRFDPPRWNITGNVVGTYVTEDVEHGEKPQDHKRLSPTLSASYRLLPDEALYLRAMVKHTFRVPTFNDLYYQRSGTVTLKPEKAKEYNLGITWQGQPFPFTRYLSFTVDGFYNDVKDKIVAFPTLYVWKMANFGKVRMLGLNASVSAEVTVREKISLLLTASYSLLRAEDVTDKSASSYKQQIPYTPRHTGNGSLVLKTPWIDLGYSVLASGERYCLQQQTPAYRLAPYWEHTLSLSRIIRWGKAQINIQATLRNLTDEQYEVVKYYPMPGRSWEVSASLAL